MQINSTLELFKRRLDFIKQWALVEIIIPVINYNSNGIDTTFSQAYVRRKTVVLYYYFCGIINLFSVANFQ